MHNILVQTLKSLNMPRVDRGEGQDLCKDCKCVGLVHTPAPHGSAPPGTGHRRVRKDALWGRRAPPVTAPTDLSHPNGASLLRSCL